MKMKSVNEAIEQIMLQPDATYAQIRSVCEDAYNYQFAAVCVSSFWLPYAKEMLDATDVRLATLIGAPFGSESTAVKAYQAGDAIRNGATELNFFLNMGAFREGHDNVVLEDLQAVLNVAEGAATVKVILAMNLLNDDQKIHLCKLLKEANVQFVQTVSDYSSQMATGKDVALLRMTLGEKVQIKAVGDVRTADVVKQLLMAGADRVGTIFGKKSLE